jgi:hypothetical protein
MREVILGCAAQGLFAPRWSARVLEEWARAAGKLGPAEEVWARGEIAALAARFPDALLPCLAQPRWPCHPAGRKRRS